MRERHLSDSRLIDVCLDRGHGAAAQRHLDGCAVCQGRRTAIAQMMSEVSAAARASADEVFTADRLRRQHADILQRIEREGRRGRLITFPAGHAQHPAGPARPAMRWIVGAAVAGVIIGLAVGHFPRDLSGRTRPSTEIAGQRSDATLQAVSTSLSEDDFLGLLEMAVEGTSGSTLQPLDDLTPGVTEVTSP